MSANQNEVLVSLDNLLVETKKKFDDAIYRVKTNTTKTADDLWAELKVAQNDTTTDGFTSGIKCVSILNELKRRGQITDW